MSAEVDAVRRLHRKSLFPASTGEHQGRHYCTHCTSIGPELSYFMWPCPTIQLLDGEPACTDPTHEHRELRGVSDHEFAFSLCSTCGAANVQDASRQSARSTMML